MATLGNRFAGTQRPKTLVGSRSLNNFAKRFACSEQRSFETLRTPVPSVNGPSLHRYSGVRSHRRRESSSHVLPSATYRPISSCPSFSIRGLAGMCSTSMVARLRLWHGGGVRTLPPHSVHCFLFFSNSPFKMNPGMELFREGFSASVAIPHL